MGMQIREARDMAGSGPKCACGLPANWIIAHESRYIPMCRGCFVKLRELMGQC